MSFFLSQVNELQQEKPTVAEIERDMLRDQLMQKERQLMEANKREEDLLDRCDDLEELNKTLEEAVCHLRDAHVLLTFKNVKLQKKMEEKKQKMTIAQKDQQLLDGMGIDQATEDRIEKAFSQLEQREEQQKRLVELKTRESEWIEELNNHHLVTIGELEDKIYQMAIDNDEESSRLEETEKLLELVEQDLSYSRGRVVDLGNELDRSEKKKMEMAAELEQALKIINVLVQL